MTARIRPLISILIINYLFGTVFGAQYLGKFIGKLSELHHGVSGEVYAVDARTLHIKDFTYDGQGPAAYFYAGNTKVAGNSGFRLRDESGSGDVIRKYRKEHVTLSLPEGKTLNNIKIFYVWCEEFAVNFGDVKISRNFDYPKPQKIDGLQGVHGISSDNIVIVDAQTLLIPNLSYDGEAPDAKFWVGHGPKPSPQGIRVPDENGKIVPLRRYDKKTIVLTLPGDLTAFDIGHFGIWCEAFTVDFGHVLIPQNLNVPPSLRMLGVSPQKRPRQFDETRGVPRPHGPLIGGHIEATTYRPPGLTFLANRRSDVAGLQQHDVVNRDISSFPQNHQNSIQRNYVPFVQQQQQYTQQQFIPQQNVPFFPQQVLHPAYLQKQQFLQQPVQHQQIQRIDQSLQNGQFFNNELREGNSFTTHNIVRQPHAYTPLNLQQNQYQEQQFAYNQLVQARKVQEQQLKDQLNRQHNRFDLTANQNAYVPFG